MKKIGFVATIAFASIALAGLAGCTQDTDPSPPASTDRHEEQSTNDDTQPEDQKIEDGVKIEPKTIRGKCTLWCCPGDPPPCP